MIITSASNDKIKRVKNLIKSSKARYDESIFVVEGIKMFKEIPDSKLVEVYVSESYVDKYYDYIKDLDYIIVKDNIFKGLSDTKTPQGILGLVSFVEKKLVELINVQEGNQNDRNPLILILEKLQDPGNMGTIIRTAEGAGVTGIIISEDSVDIYNPKVVRSTMGSIFRVPILRTDNLLSVIDKLKENDITIYGAHLDGNEFYNMDYIKGSAFLVGNEGNGLSKEVSEKADELIRIHMEGQVESLNASISAAILSYEALRQRTTRQN